VTSFLAHVAWVLFLNKPLCAVAQFQSSVSTNEMAEWMLSDFQERSDSSAQQVCSEIMAGHYAMTSRDSLCSMKAWFEGPSLYVHVDVHKEPFLDRKTQGRSFELRMGNYTVTGVLGKDRRILKAHVTDSTGFDAQIWVKRRSLNYEVVRAGSVKVGSLNKDRVQNMVSYWENYLRVGYPKCRPLRQ
jgi:hypothetical protein